MLTAPVLALENITKRYRGIAAVENVSFQLDAGEIAGYLGPNGSGKSTTVKIITGMLQPNHGRVLFRGRPIHDNIVAFRAVLGYVPEEAHVYTHLSGLEYLQLVGRLRGMTEKLIALKANTLLNLLALESWRYSPISLYSKGMKQRVLIAAALMHNPQLLIFDEPLSGLDVTTALVFRKLVAALAGRGKIILYSSHVLEVVERLCSHVLVLHKGNVAAYGEMAAVRRSAPLEEVFADLTNQRDTDETARGIVEVMCGT